MNVFYLVAASSTILLFVLGFALWAKTRSANFIFGTLALYFWSIHGTWGLAYDKTIGSELFRYHYLEEALFAVNLDEDYLTSIVFYVIFCLAVLVTSLLVVNGSRPVTTNRNDEKIHLNHAMILLFSIGSAVASYLVIANAFAEAIILGQTGYAAIGSETIQYFTIHQILNRAALFSALIGFVILMSGSRNRFFKSRSRSMFLVLYAVVSALIVAYLAILGNKNELFTGFVFAALFYIGTHSGAPIRRTIGVGVVLLFIVASVDYLRNFAILSGDVADIETSELLEQSTRIVFSNEAFAAHLSMYGAVKHDIEPTFGTGLNALVFSFVPIDIWPDRPIGNYGYYAEQVGAESGRGYTIHHATSWYLDFGLFGVVIGGVVLGAIWATLHNVFLAIGAGKFGIRRIFCIVATFGFSAYLPVIIRAGVEVYKGAFIGAVAIPMVFLLVGAISARQGSSKNELHSADAVA